MQQGVARHGAALALFVASIGSELTGVWRKIVYFPHIDKAEKFILPYSAQWVLFASEGAFLGAGLARLGAFDGAAFGDAFIAFEHDFGH